MFQDDGFCLHNVPFELAEWYLGLGDRPSCSGFAEFHFLLMEGEMLKAEENNHLEILNGKF